DRRHPAHALKSLPVAGCELPVGRRPVFRWQLRSNWQLGTQQLATTQGKSMPSHRSLRMAQAIREVVATAILFEVADPRVRAVTVLGVEVSGDLRHAKVHVSIMGTEAQQQRALEGLNHASGFLQARVAARLQTRFTPI